MSKEKKKFYAVARGHEPGIYSQWFGEKGAEAQVKGFPDARYKGFTTRPEAQQWFETVRQGRDPADARSNGTQADLFPGPGPGPEPSSAKRKKTQPKKPQRKIAAAQELKAGKVIVYTDGGCIDNPGPGGYGVVLLQGKDRQELSGGFRRTTNNRMELTACIEGLKTLKETSTVVLFSDSKYVVNGIEKGWAKRWRRNGWKRSIKAAAENADLWSQLLELCEKHQVEFSWVKGHAGNPGNERCDELATLASRNEKKQLRDTAFETGKTTLVNDKTLFS
ncbi:MAG: ribonuclease HI [Candidatus Aminicenantes bacterium]|nr:ribonuclease HI [Candidatus Aminicenantes bacterium]